MELITLLSLLSLNLFYIPYIVYINDGHPLHSISDSWYLLKSHNQEHLFTLYCFLLCIGLVFLTSLHPLFFFSGTCFAFVGVSTEFKDTKWITDEIHYISALIGIVSSLIGLWIITSPLPLIIFIIGSLLIYYFKKESNTHIFWIELLAITLILWTLFLS